MLGGSLVSDVASLTSEITSLTTDFIVPNAVLLVWFVVFVVAGAEGEGTGSAPKLADATSKLKGSKTLRIKIRLTGGQFPNFVSTAGKSGPPAVLANSFYRHDSLSDGWGLLSRLVN